MRIPFLTFGAFASVLTLNAFADTTSSTVTSKNYVDTKFQEKIPVNSITIETKGGSIAVPNALIVSPNDTPGEIGAVGIWDADLNNVPEFARAIAGNDFSPVEDALRLTDLIQQGELIPTAEVIGLAAALSLDEKQTKKVCVGWPDGTTVADATHTDENCWLWNLPD